MTRNRVLVVRVPQLVEDAAEYAEYIRKCLHEGILILGSDVQYSIEEFPQLGAVEIVDPPVPDSCADQKPRRKRSKPAPPETPNAVELAALPPRPAAVTFVEGLHSAADASAAQRLPMSEGEIVTSYKQAANPAEQIDTLTELNNCSRELILEVLRSAGVLQDEHIVRKRRKGSQPHFDRDVARQLYEEGLSDEEIAAKLEVSDYTIRRWRSEDGLYRKKRRAKDEA